MSKGKRRQEGKKVHQNKYASESHAEAYLTKKLAQQASPLKPSAQETSGNFRRVYELPHESSSVFRYSYRPSALSSSYDRLGLSGSRSSSGNSDLGGSVSDSRFSGPGFSEDDGPVVQDCGCWWRYRDYYFMKPGSEPGNCFSREEVPTIRGQLPTPERYSSTNKYPVVRGVDDKLFYIKFDRDHVEIPLTEYLGLDGEKKYGRRRTCHEEEILGLRPDK